MFSFIIQNNASLLPPWIRIFVVVFALLISVDHPKCKRLLDDDTKATTKQYISKDMLFLPLCFCCCCCSCWVCNTVWCIRNACFIINSLLAIRIVDMRNVEPKEKDTFLFAFVVSLSLWLSIICIFFSRSGKCVLSFLLLPSLWALTCNVIHNILYLFHSNGNGIFIGSAIKIKSGHTKKL